MSSDNAIFKGYLGAIIAVFVVFAGLFQAFLLHGRTELEANDSPFGMVNDHRVELQLPGEAISAYSQTLGFSIRSPAKLCASRLRLGNPESDFDPLISSSCCGSGLPA